MRVQNLLALLVPVAGFQSPQQSPLKKVVSSSTTELSMVGGPVLQKVAVKAGVAAAGALLAGTGIVKFYLDKPSRTYGAGTVAKEYDEWTEEGILEYYWGEHIHLGYYSEAEKYMFKPLKDAQYAFIDEMMKFGGIDPSTDGKAKVLDVGCGFGGTSRYLARALGPDAEVTAITLSPKQVERAKELAIEQNTPNCNFMVQDALAMEFPDNTFDIVWACESGEHMPDKKAYIEQMMRVLKPGGKFVMATWCQRDDSKVPFDKRDKRDLQYLYEEWYVIMGQFCSSVRLVSYLPFPDGGLAASLTQNVFKLKFLSYCVRPEYYILGRTHISSQRNPMLN